MYGIFFEDINFGADGGLYAEMVENRSFEFPNRLMGWNAFGNVTVNEKTPAFDRNPHYATLEASGHSEKVSGLENHGFFGMGLKKDMTYNFSVYARLHLLNGKQAKIRVELVDDQDNVINRQTISVDCNQWKKFTCTLKSDRTVEKGLMRIFLEGNEGIDLDHVSLMPADNWHGLRADLVKDLEDAPSGRLPLPWWMHRGGYRPGHTLPVEEHRRRRREPSAQREPLELHLPPSSLPQLLSDLRTRLL